MPIDTTELERRIEAARAAATEFARSVRNEFGPRVERIRLFGSFARGDATLDSDVDITVILKRAHWRDRNRISHLAFHIGALKHEVVIMPLILSVTHFKRLLDRERAVALAIQREGVKL
ncbi:MAG TPA: nucleotidyltransferase domain-containing protein [Acidobacteriota bacterium]|nr:nucleotidyltransferase domain-containing protein [Acidobacteriota bacterium]